MVRELLKQTSTSTVTSAALSEETFHPPDATVTFDIQGDSSMQDFAPHYPENV